METNFCPSCGSKVIDAGNLWRCEMMEKCPAGFKAYKTIASYALTDEDLAAICAGEESEEHEFTAKAGNAFTARVSWSAEERKVVFKFPNGKVEGAFCPVHNVELRVGKKAYYCPVKAEDGTYCEVTAWLTFGSHSLTAQELVDLLDGMPVGPWEMQKRDGSGTYKVMPQWDFEQNKVITPYVNDESVNAKAQTGPTMTSTDNGNPVAVESKSQEVPIWVEALPAKAEQVAQLLGLAGKGKLMCEAAISKTTGGMRKTAAELISSEEANAVVREFNALARGETFPMSQFGDDGKEYYVIQPVAEAS